MALLTKNTLKKTTKTLMALGERCPGNMMSTLHQGQRYRSFFLEEGASSFLHPLALHLPPPHQLKQTNKQHENKNKTILNTGALRHAFFQQILHFTVSVCVCVCVRLAYSHSFQRPFGHTVNKQADEQNTQGWRWGCGFDEAGIKWRNVWE